jgi:hypothetical protein
MRRHLDPRVLGAAAITLVVWSVLLTVVAQVKFAGDPRGFLFLGERLYHPDPSTGFRAAAGSATTGSSTRC